MLKHAITLSFTRQYNITGVLKMEWALFIPAREGLRLVDDPWAGEESRPEAVKLKIRRMRGIPGICDLGFMCYYR